MMARDECKVIAKVVRISLEGNMNVIIYNINIKNSVAIQTTLPSKESQTVAHQTINVTQ